MPRYLVKSTAMLILTLWLTMALLVHTPSTVKAGSPEWQAAGSFLIPGLGQMVNEDYGAGVTHFAIYNIAAYNYFKLAEDPNYILPEDRDDETTNTYAINRTTFMADFYGTMTNATMFYSSFGAYRDARMAGNKQAEYTTPAPQESLGDLMLSPFNLDFLTRPGTYIPLLLPLYMALTPADPEQWVYLPDNTITRDELRKGYFFQHQMVALGEEAFFRGVLNNGFSDWMGEGWGLMASSAVFGLAHTGNAGSAGAGTATLFGLYLGYLQQDNEYAIGQGVALHYWWNFLVTLALLKERDNLPPVQLVDIQFRF